MVATLIHTGHTDEWTDRQADGGAEERMDEETTCSHFRRRERFYGDLMSPAKINVLTSSCIGSDSFVRL